MTGIENKFISAYPKILVTILKTQPVSITDVMRETGITFSHISEAIIDMKRMKLVDREKKGRKVLLTIRPEGADVAIAFEKVIRLLKELGKRKRSVQ